MSGTFRYFIVVTLLTVFIGCTEQSNNTELIQETKLPAVSKPTRELSVGFLVVDGVYNSELVAPMDILHHTIFHTDPGMKVFLVAEKKQPITTFEGLRIIPDFDFTDAPNIDVLVVPSAEHSMDTDLENEALIQFVNERGQRAMYVMSLCDGAFVLAKAGLTSGHESTTFPGDITRYRKTFPELIVHEDVSFVHDGKLITSAGGAKSYDPALYLVELLYGNTAAKGVAKGLVIDWNLSSIQHKIIH